MHVLKIACHICLSVVACLSAGGCARSYDGTIVPEYTTEMVSDGPVPRFETRKTDLLPPSRLVEFPDTPPPPVSEQPPPPRVTQRRQPARILPRIDGNVPRNVNCVNSQAPDGRIRVLCM